MKASDLVPAHKLAQRFGVKAIMYGGPGVGKTPLINTAPRPVLLVSEPGMLSMRNSNIPSFLGDTTARISEFMTWAVESKEAQSFDTIAFDSLSQIAEIVLGEQLPKNKDPRKAYGEMSLLVNKWAHWLFYMQNKHVVLICKQTHDEVLNKKKPYFPGQDLNVKIPHLYDEILNLGKHNVPGIGETLAIRAKEDYAFVARDRSGNLGELEPPNLADLFKKCML